MIIDPIKSAPYAEPLRSGRGGRRFESYHSDHDLPGISDTPSAEGAQDSAQDAPDGGPNGLAYPVPESALDADIAILGRKGGGKTFTAKGIVERLLDQGRRVLILDPLGVWAGLRTGADGQSPGYPVAIFGGLHGDMPLDTAAAKPMAAIIARENVPAVIDLSELSKNAQQSFLLAFLHELRRANTEALTLVLEEADVFAPQNPLGDDSKALHGEIDWIARRGRSRGFRLITVTQRPARLSKDVLTQCATLIAHRLPAPQDRDAVKAWVDGNGDKELARSVFDTLAQLQVGEAWIYASEEGTLARHRFPAIKTLDTSATPKAGEKRIEPKTLAQVDVSAIRSALQEAQRAAGHPDDARSAKKTQVGPPDPQETAAAEQRGYARGYADGHRHGFTLGASKQRAAVAAAIQLDIEYETPALAETATVAQRDPRPRADVPKAARSPRQNDAGLSPALQRALDAVAWWHKIGQVPIERARAAVVAGLSPKASTFGVYVADLIKRGLVAAADGKVSLTEAGTASANFPAAATRRELHDMAASLLSPAEARAFDVVYAAVPDPIERHRVAAELGLSPKASTTGVYLSAIASYGLIENAGPGKVRAAAWLFPERRRS